MFLCTSDSICKMPFLFLKVADFKLKGVLLGMKDVRNNVKVVHSQKKRLFVHSAAQIFKKSIYSIFDC